MSSNLHRYLDSLAEVDASLPPSPASSNGSIYNPPPRSAPPPRSEETTARYSRRGSTASFFSDTTQTTTVPGKRDYYPPDNYDDEGINPLMQAAKHDQIDTVQRLLDTGVPIDDIDSDGRTALFHAATHASADMVKVLLDAGADPFMVAGVRNVPKFGRQRLHKATIKIAFLEEKRAIIYVIFSRKKGTSQDVYVKNQDYERTCLHQAAGARSTGALDVVRLLLDTMGDEAKLEQDKAGLIPIHLAINKGNINIVNELLTDNVPEQLRAITKDYHDCALHLAVRRTDLNIMKVLVDHGAELNATNLEGQTPLHIACAEADEHLVKFLHESHASASIKDRECHKFSSEKAKLMFLCGYVVQSNLDVMFNKIQRNRTALHVATEAGSKEIIEMLIDKFHADMNQRSKDGSTLVHLAAKCGYADVALYFVKRGVQMEMPNRDGAGALHEAAKQGHVNVVKALLSKGATMNMVTKNIGDVLWKKVASQDVDVLNQENYNPLHTAVRYGKHLVVQEFLGRGCNVNAKGGMKNETSLHLAAKLQRYSEHVVEMLLKSGVRINELNLDKDTALHTAIKHRNYPVVKMLIKHSALVDTKNEAGETPLHLSVRYMSVAIALEIIDDLKRDMDKNAYQKAVNEVNNAGETALHLCASIKPKVENQRTYTDLCKLLLDNHAELHHLTYETEETPLHYCCRSGNSDVLRMILKNMTPKESNKAANMVNKAGWSPLLIASQLGYTGVVRTLLENQARVDVFDEYGKAALHIASENGHLECAELLLEKKAYVNAKTKLGLTAVSLAAANGHNQLVELLITKYGASYEILALNKRSALHLAAERGHLHACKTLLELGSDPNITDLNEQTPIHGAAENDHPEIIKLFLKQFPELASFINKDGKNCAHIAASKGSLEALKALFKADPSMASTKNKVRNATTIHGKSMIQDLDVKVQMTGQMPIHLAAAGGHTEVIQILLDQGVPVKEEDKEGMTPLHLAAKFGQRGSMDLLRSKINFSVVSNKTGFTPLHVASEHDQTGAMADLLQRVHGSVTSECPVGKDPEDTEYGYSSLHLAAKNGHAAAVRQLINSDGVMVDVATTKKGLVPLHMAIVEGHMEVASLLLSRSADQIMIKCAMGRTPLHFAAAHGHLQLLQLLLGQGAEVDDQDNNGWTPLHYAADAGYLDVVRYLVQMGALSTIEDKDGKAALAFAAKNHHLDVMKFLLLNEYDVEELLQDKKFLAHLMICCKLNNNVSAQDFILNSPAPIYTAIKLTLMYREESLRVKDKSQDYLEIAQFCEEMTYDILHIATTYGCEQLLNAIDDAKQPLLDILIDNEFKDCVAHANVQGYLSDLWRGNDIHVEGVFAILAATLCFIFPPLWFFLCLPFHKWNKIPTLKFICHIVSHMYFIIVLTLVIVVPWDRSYLEVYPTPWEWLTLLFITGHLLSEVCEPDHKLIRIAELIFAFLGMGIHLAACFMEGRTREDIMYARDNVLAFLLLILVVQILQFLSLYQMFGPWSVIILSLIIDVIKFLIIMFLFMIGFTLHFCVIYRPVYGKTLVEIPTEVLSFVNQPDGALTIFDMLFFSLFGLANRPDKIKGAALETNSEGTYIVATIVFALYQLLAVIVLVNLLIAMMSNTFAELSERSDIEWKYGRAGIICTMINSYSMPVPVNVFAQNLIMIWVSVKYAFCCCRVTIDHYAREKPEKPFDDTESQVTETSEAPSYDPTDKNAPIPILHVVPWKTISEEFRINHNIEEILLPPMEDMFGAPAEKDET